jgi:hypothetical protein
MLVFKSALKNSALWGLWRLDTRILNSFVSCFFLLAVPPTAAFGRSGLGYTLLCGFAALRHIPLLSLTGYLLLLALKLNSEFQF